MKRRQLLKNDLIFKKIFGRKENFWILQAFIYDLCGILIKDISYLDPTKIFSMRHSGQKNKLTDAQISTLRTRIVDILAEIDGQTMLTLEMQVRKTEYFLERIVLYIADVYGYNYNNKEKMKDPNNKFSSLEPVIQVSILDYNEFPDDKAIHQFSLQDEENGNPYLIKIFVLELRKLLINVSDPIRKKHLKFWIKLFNGEEIGPDAPDYIQAASKLTNYYNLTREEQIEVDAIEIAMEEREAELSYAERYGEAKGMEKGEEKGEVRAKEQIARNLLAQGVDLKVISSATNLSVEEIERLK
ncbi:Rpn family recombination-promoting nuclease/putative transposase [Xylocopilactobacillus apicola]|uniref:Rpn family recombination-promoting nuclease/putative transposase n=1 Tax=Xylocopilactobacillus apicola TaxID=2932184 RepID=A0AAU9DFF9_9LACO|nr:Rpn family recombination-promoting nuclease/putative transposase [Xylocopilactobacillus apicola]BDR59672.1 hypothetical protein XA3_21130 [Xylocopilactobacillus apicola]